MSKLTVAIGPALFVAWAGHADGAAEKVPGDGVVFDLRPMYLWAHKSPDVDPELRRLIMSYDALVFLRDGAPQFRWYPDSP